jgi:hypothetical protein
MRGVFKEQMDINTQALSILYQFPLAIGSVVALFLAILTLWYPTGFVLHYLDIYFIRFRYGQYVSLLLVSIFFGVLHYSGGWKYILLATIAGIVYGYIYQKTKRIEASILTHFVLNTLHFLLFTYPALYYEDTYRG